MTVAVSHDLSIEDVPVNQVRLRFRLRTPKESKVEEIAESIATLGLLNPVTVDNQGFLICGFHRLLAVKSLGWETIPAIRKDFSLIYSELGEIDENLKRSELNHIEIAEHIVRREELLEQLGLRMKSGYNKDKSLVTTTELAKQINLSNRVYRLKRQPASIEPDVRDEIKETKFADNLLDMVKLSQQTPEVQRKISQLLISGKCSTFKRAMVEGNMQIVHRSKEYKIDFDMKEKFGIPHSIINFKKAKQPLQELCNLVAHDEELQWKKREGIHFGETTIPVAQMPADHAEFLINYYIPENGIVMDQFSGRATTCLASLYHGRQFIGFDIDERNINRTKQVLEEHFPDHADRYQLFHSDGIALEELKDKSEYLSGVVTSPPYIANNERYTEDPRDLSGMNQSMFMEKMTQNFHELYRLIKTSSFEEKIFYPVIFVVGTGRKGKEGIIDMSTEFQLAARDAGFKLWDVFYNELRTPWGSVNWERNYINRYVQKAHETNLVFCKF